MVRSGHSRGVRVGREPAAAEEVVDQQVTAHLEVGLPIAHHRRLDLTSCAIRLLIDADGHPAVERHQRISQRQAIIVRVGRRSTEDVLVEACRRPNSGRVDFVTRHSADEVILVLSLDVEADGGHAEHAILRTTDRVNHEAVVAHHLVEHEVVGAVRQVDVDITIASILRTHRRGSGHGRVEVDLSVAPFHRVGRQRLELLRRGRHVVGRDELVVGFRRAVATVIRRGRGPSPREEVATFGHVVYVDRHVRDGAILRGDLDGHIAVAPVLTIGRRGSGGSRRQVGVAVGVEVRRVVGGPSRTQARGRVVGHHHGLADHLRRAVAAIVGGRHRPRPREGEAAFGLSVSTVTSVGRSAVGVSRRDGDIAVTGVHGHGHWARRRREVREAVGIERVVRGAHRREGRDGRCGHVERGDVLRHGLDGLVAAIIRTGDGERPHEGVGTLGCTVRTVAGVVRSAVRVLDHDVDNAVAIVINFGYRRHARDGRARVGPTERIDVDRHVGRGRSGERRSRIVDHRHKARDLLRRRVAAVVGRRELVRAQDREGTRARQASILLGAVEVERRDLHVVVTVVRGAGSRVRHTVHVVGEAVGVR